MALTTLSTTPEVVPAARAVSYLEWGPVVAGAIAAAAISFLLLSFGAAVGLSLTSPWPDSGVRLWVVALAVGWWAVAVQVASFAAGGYLAGRMRTPWPATGDEAEFRDNAHGFMVWAVGVLVGALLIAMTGAATLRTAVQTTGMVAAGAAGGASAALSMTPADYAVDLLLRPSAQPGTPAGGTPAGGTPSPAAPGRDTTRDASDQGLRAEAARIFTATIRNREFSARDRDYLVGVVQTRTGLPEAEARARVDAAVNEARDVEIKLRRQADQARRAAVVTGFIAAASLLISLVVACFTAGIGGRHRDENRAPLFYGHRFW
jgi:hypothetical protein